VRYANSRVAHRARAVALREVEKQLRERRWSSDLAPSRNPGLAPGVGLSPPNTPPHQLALPNLLPTQAVSSQL
jgi:hypothetical protein